MADRRPYIYDDGTTDAERYLEGCLDGTYVVCRHVKKLAERMLGEIRNGYKKWHYSPEHAIRPVRFIESFCRLTASGKDSKPFVLEPYELVVVELAFGFVDDDGLRRFREVLIEWARKCGKTALLAALNLYMLTSDGEMGAEVYNGATSKEQASLCYGTTWDMVRASPMLRKRLVKGRVEKRNTQGIRYDQKMSYLVTISSNSNNLDGLNCHFAVLDELAASRDGGATYHVIKGSMGSRLQPMIVMISSNGKVRDGIFDDRRDYCIKWLNGEVEDDRFIGFLYEMDSREEINDMSMWPKASPGLGSTKSWDYLRDLLSQAQQNPRDMPEVITK
jgi:phage terminase large subunit-like protein